MIFWIIFIIFAIGASFLFGELMKIDDLRTKCLCFEDRAACRCGMFFKSPVVETAS